MDFFLERLTEATMLWSGFLGGLFLLRWLLPGPVQAGRVLGDGTREHYKVNGLAVFGVVAVVVAVTQVTGLFSLVTVRRLFWPLFIVANVFAVLHTAWLFAVGRRHHRDLAAKPGGVLRDLWFGSELNPELWGVDLKLFGYVPSLLALWVVNLSFAMSQWEATGHLTSRVIVYETLVTLYIVNYFQFERGMVHTWDIVSERFGWMLVWGDYVLVPFVYSIAGWYVARNPDPMSAALVAVVVILFAVGMAMFRGANSQKHRFKEQPATATTWGRPARTLGGNCS